MIDLPAEQMAVVLRILAAHVPEVEVRAFGSRVTGKALRHSDLDLVLLGDVRVDARRLDALKDALSESDLPIQVDVIDWNAISAQFQKVIERKYEIVRKADPKHGSAV